MRKIHSLKLGSNHCRGRTISKATSGSSPKARMTSMSRRNEISTSSVLQLPNRIQITFGGAPRSAARKPNSLSLETRTNPPRGNAKSNDRRFWRGLRIQCGYFPETDRRDALPAEEKGSGHTVASSASEHRIVFAVRRVCQGGENIFPFQVWEIRKDLLLSHAGSPCCS